MSSAALSDGECRLLGVLWSYYNTEGSPVTAQRLREEMGDEAGPVLLRLYERGYAKPMGPDMWTITVPGSARAERESDVPKDDRVLRTRSAILEFLAHPDRPSPKEGDAAAETGDGATFERIVEVLGTWAYVVQAQLEYLEASGLISRHAGSYSLTQRGRDNQNWRPQTFTH